MRISKITKLEIAKKHVIDGVPIHELAKIYNYDSGRVKYMVDLYKTHGEQPFLAEEGTRTYTREYKLKCIKAVLNNEITARALAIKEGLSDDTILRDWITKYKKEGESSIKDTHNRSHYLKHEERLDYIADKSLKDRLEYLEAENEYLKKLYALTLKGRKQRKKK